MRFSCPNCRHKLEMDESQAGQKATCPFCSRPITIPEPPPDEGPKEKLKLKVHVEKQAYEAITPTDKTCPKCKSSCDVRALLCVSCGFNFVTESTTPEKGHKRSMFSGLFGALCRLAWRVFLIVALVVVLFIGFVWFQHARLSQLIPGELERGELGGAMADYRKLASYYRWFEYVRWPNPYALRYQQFQAREGKTFPETKNPVYPFLVVKSVWGNKQELNMKVGWVKFCLVNLDTRPLDVGRKMFLLMGLDNNVALAHEAREEDPKPITLLRNDAVLGSLYFAGIVKQPAFLEFNNGSLVLRAPTYINFAMDNYDRDHRDWPQGRGAEEFPMLKSWDTCRLPAEEVSKYVSAYHQLKPPPAEPYTTVMKETNPR